ncbi:hypothetical protein CANARDRAFT_176169 [[Candida] arabinofermentans NRRL YB-2248]|uniref:SET domain-containing protein n=1 Tax=[Candida] arabinofermentans NRRL YB-2248 TaxID=983967 RepID=A0A1E4T0B0_9ASCO|nr:hypothetical protein CANARDRAFT_176169 [[Candida] arabinofermentans NRRL YB-2248]
MPKFERLVSWLDGRVPGSNTPKSSISPKLSVKDDPQQGRSIYASTQIQKHEPLITIPHSFMLNYISILAHLSKWNSGLKVKGLNYGQIYVPEQENDIYTAIYEKLIPDQVLNLSSFQLVSLYLVLEKKRGDASYWKPFIDVLPEVDELKAIPFTWKVKDPENSFYSLLAPSVLKRSNEQYDKFNKDYNVVCDLTGSDPDNDIITKPDFLWAWLCCNTRCLYMTLPSKLNKTVEDNFTLVPFVDFINHNLDDSCSVDISASKGFVVDSGETTYEENTQVFFSYGAHGDDFLICEYGFMFEPELNYWNYIDLSPYIMNSLKDEHKQFLEKESYLGDYTATKSELSFRTEVALACLQEQPSSFLEGKCPARLRSFMNGMTEGKAYATSSNLLVKKIMTLMKTNASKKIQQLNDVHDNGEHVIERQVVQRSHENSLNIIRQYTK